MLPGLPGLHTRPGLPAWPPAHLPCGTQSVTRHWRVCCPALQYLGYLGCEYVVFPNDAKTVDEIRAMNPRGILVSPGPGAPRPKP